VVVVVVVVVVVSVVVSVVVVVVPPVVVEVVLFGLVTTGGVLEVSLLQALAANSASREPAKAPCLFIVLP
jgi:hypothetical protein